MSAPAPTRLLLVGMMGCGKTTVGRVVAEATGWPYVDNDELVAQVAGAATPEVGARSAEALHVIEGVVVEQILAMDPPLVAGIPGSAVAAVDTREHLRAHGTVVWLRASIETLAARVGDGATRPFFAGRDVSEVLRELYVGRAPAYEAAAHHVVDVDERTPEEIAAWIVEKLRAPSGTAGPD
jgi:shikimate kinase